MRATRIHADPVSPISSISRGRDAKCVRRQPALYIVVPRPNNELAAAATCHGMRCRGIIRMMRNDVMPFETSNSKPVR